MSVTPNQFRRAEDITAPGELREGRWHAFEPAPPVTRVLGGRPFQLRPGLTFTPYANPVACNAHCSFCSEELLRHDAERLTAKLIIPDHDAWFDALDSAWRELAGFPMGLSLSGLEATAHPEWMLRLLSLLRRHDALFPLRVLYTNGSGLFADQRLITGLVESRFDRVELSRCHFDERVNHRVMRFDQGVGVRTRAAFDETVRRVLAAGLTLKLVCILNTQATSTLDDVERYLDAAEALGVKQVVFRSLSELGDRYVESRETRWIQRHRAPTRPLLEAIMSDERVLRAGWRFVGMTAGYYYSNEVYRRGGVEVVLESASYVAHHDEVRRGVLQKLVFHSTGVLAGDWVPNAQVVGSYLSP